MVMITGTRDFPAVNHAASSALLPTLLAPHNKYAIIYLSAAGGWEKTSHCKTTQTHTLMLVSVLRSHITCLLKGTLNYPFLYSRACLCAVLMCTNVGACGCAKSCKQGRDPTWVNSSRTCFPWQHVHAASCSDNVIGSWLIFSVDQMTSPPSSSSLWYRSFWCSCLMVCLRAFGFSLSQWTNQICRGTLDFPIGGCRHWEEEARQGCIL